jgi:phage/plasmid primase-like uncharacterized protein
MNDFPDAEQQFRDAAEARGLALPLKLVENKLTRCGVSDAESGSDGAYIWHFDGLPAGGFQNHKDGFGWQSWHANPRDGRRLTPAELREIADRQKRALEQARREEAKRRKEVARKAKAVLEAATPARDDHPYLVSKKIAPNGFREIAVESLAQLLGYTPKAGGIEITGRVLVIPMQDETNAVWSLQFIDVEGRKTNLYGGRKNGCFAVIGELMAAGKILIGEGPATMASCHEATGESSVIAFDCGNLELVTLAIQAKYPEAALIFCADADTWTDGDPGQSKAGEVARAVNGVVAVPAFSGERLAGQTDFNDLAQAEGLDAVRACIEVATAPKMNVAGKIRRLAELGEGDVLHEKAKHAKRLGLTATDFARLLKKEAKAIKDERLAEERKIRAERIAAQVDGSDCPYRLKNGGIYYTYPTRDGDEAERRLANFTATIAADVIRDDGVETLHVFEIEARLNGRALTFPVAAAQFAGLGWVAQNMGARAVVGSGAATKDKVREAIQLLSGNISERHVYTHIGWRKIGDDWAYLHAGGAIGKAGALDGVEVSLHGGLADYRLAAPPCGEELKTAIRTSLRILDLAEDRVTFPALAAVWRAPLGASDFSPFLSGLTGVMKSELAALMQAHWGAAFHGKHLPAAWSSTANSLEAQAFLAKDALFVVDDFIPRGSTADVARLHEKADRVLRAQGNNSGRGRCNPDGTPRPEKPPRGLIVSTGEEIPAGHSLRARLFLVEMKPNGLDLEKLTELQQFAGEAIFAAAMAGYVRWMAGRYKQVTDGYRQAVRKMRETGDVSSHLRTNDIVRALTAAWSIFLDYAQDSGAIDKARRLDLERRAAFAFAIVAEEQSEIQRASDPVARFGELLRSAIKSGEAYVAQTDGKMPVSAESWGWREVTRDNWQPQGACVGWLDIDNLYLEPTTAHRIAEKMAAQGQSLGLTVQTLSKRLSERGLISTEMLGGKRRLTTRKTIAKQRVQVLHARITLVYPDDDSKKVHQLAHSEMTVSKSAPRDEAANRIENTEDFSKLAHLVHLVHKSPYRGGIENGEKKHNGVIPAMEGDL